MQLIKKINDIVSNVDGYKNQFVTNELPNVLLIDPQTSRFEFYSMILPTIVLNSEEKINLAFTKIQKFKAGPQRELINLTETEIKWADVIVFPFSIATYQGEQKHLFDEIREINTDCKIVLLHEVLSSATKFFENVIFNIEKISGSKVEKSLLPKIKQNVSESISNNINRADKIIVPNKMVSELVGELIGEISSKKTIIVHPKNYQELINEGFSKLETLDLLDPSEIRVWVNFINDGSSKEMFIEHVMKDAPENVMFYSSEKIDLPNCHYVSSMSISHYYKVFYQKKFHYQFFVSNTNVFEKASLYQEGLIVDGLFSRSVPIFTNPRMIPDGFKVESCSIKNIVEKYFLIPFDEIIALNNFYFLELQNHLVNESVIDFYNQVFLSFEG